MMTLRPSVAIRRRRLNCDSVSETVSRVEPIRLASSWCVILSATSVPRASSTPYAPASFLELHSLGHAGNRVRTEVRQERNLPEVPEDSLGVGHGAIVAAIAIGLRLVRSLTKCACRDFSDLAAGTICHAHFKRGCH